MATVVTSTEGASLTWAASTFAWNSASAVRSWAHFSVYSHTVEDNQTLVFAEEPHVNIKEIIINEVLAFREILSQNANAIISDLAVFNTEMTDAEFDEAIAGGAHLGYDRFKTLTPGDYKYIKALIGIYVDNSLNAGIATITDAKITVDAPDIINKAAVAVAGTGWTAVTFARPYNTTDELEVSVVFKSGATLGIAEWRNVTVTGFEVKLSSFASPGTQIAGNVTYDARGI